MIAGGCIDYLCNTVINQVWKYSPSKQKWTELADLPYPNYRFRLVSLKEHIYIFGSFNLYEHEGYKHDGTEVYKLSPQVSEKWKKVGHLAAFSFATDYSRLVVIPIVKEIEL